MADPFLELEYPEQPPEIQSNHKRVSLARLGQKQKGVQSPECTYVIKLEGPGWIGAYELMELLKCPFSWTYRVVRRGYATSALLLPSGKRYYQFTREGWANMLKDNTMRYARATVKMLKHG